jgi:hypothetical protein
LIEQQAFKLLYNQPSFATPKYLKLAWNRL